MPRAPSRLPDFKEAVEWFRKRVPMFKGEFEELSTEEKDRAFTVARVTQLEVIADVWEALESAIAKGTTFDDFRRAVGGKLTRAWGDERPWHLETVYRTNVQMAYARGREEQMTDPDVLSMRPYWRFVALLDQATTPICRPLHGVVMEATNPWWRTHSPPLHYNCRSTKQSLTPEMAQSYGIRTKPKSSPPLDGFGMSRPVEWQPDLDLYPPQLVQVFKSGE